MHGFVHNACGFADAALGMFVRVGRETPTIFLAVLTILCRVADRSGAVPKPGHDAAPRDALYSPSLQCGEAVGWEMGF